MLYVQREQKKGRPTANVNSIYFGRFCSVESGGCAKVIPWCISIGDDARSWLILYLSKKKRKVINILPNNQETELSTTYPLMSIKPLQQQNKSAAMAHNTIGER